MSNLSSLFDRYKALVIFDTETSGLDPEKDQIIELAALRVERTAARSLRIAGKMDTFIKLPEGELLPENIVTLTGITDELLQSEGVRPDKAASQIVKLMNPGPALMIAHNAQFDACFLRELLRGVKVGRPDWLDSLTVYKDRRPYPHKLANAILAYDLGDKVQNSHRAIDDVLALFEVLKAMDEERDDLTTYVNLFGYNQKYGVSGRRITGVRYEPQGFIKAMSRPEQTLPARLARKQVVT
ncbi:3'-5' exonuclease [Oscillibacter sp.]|uniref:3'-5' exonuclease n=1 Tax=Oscillibacter sp. TaxID=1945593 RepID=UPI00258591D8|nr:3'-5' exonuclease [Oscillibacter sp.]